VLVGYRLHSGQYFSRPTITLATRFENMGAVLAIPILKRDLPLDEAF
jgi:hypothetical protein